MRPSVARRAWQLLEPYHALVYFDPATKATYESVGLKGYWMGYFASRSAAMGAVGPELVTAIFYNFHPGMVRRALPDAWKLSSPEAVLEARHRLADTALRRVLGDALRTAEMSEAAAIARDLAESCIPEGRPLFAAHASLPWPGEPHLVLWHAATLWREFRGDGHWAAMLTHGVDGCEAPVLAAGAGVLPAEQREYRGWSEDEWEQAAERLRERGLLDVGSRLTSEGKALRDRIEELTDELSLPPLEALGDQRVQHLFSLMEPLCKLIRESGVLPYPNAMGLPAAGSA